MAVLSDTFAGNSYPTTANLFVPAAAGTVSIAQSNVQWSLIDDNQVTYASGAATIASTSTTATGDTKVALTATIAIPNGIPANPIGVSYTIQYTAYISNGSAISTYRIYEGCTVKTPDFNATGPVTSIEIWGNTVDLDIVLSQQPSDMLVSLYQNNNQILAPYGINLGTLVQVTDGYQYSLPAFNTAQINAPSMEPILVIWDYALVTGGQRYKETGRLFCVTPRILWLMQNLQQILQRALTAIDNSINTADFRPADLLHWLQFGKGYFNGFASPTNMTMTNVSDVVGYYLIQCSAIQALRSQALVEALKAFDYGGQQVQLKVDYAPAFEKYAEQLERQIEKPLTQFKLLLSKRGYECMQPLSTVM